jgi:hypothetical protein
VLGHRVMAASTMGPGCAFTFGHVRQLDQVTGEILARAWAAGAGPGDGPLVVDVDSTICEVRGYHKQGACHGYTHRLGYHPLLAARANSGELLHARLRKGAATTGRGILRLVDQLGARRRRSWSPRRCAARPHHRLVRRPHVDGSGGPATPGPTHHAAQ